MNADASAEMAAVVVIRSRLTSLTQRRYVSSVEQPSPASQTQVPPESERIEALTEIFKEITSDLPRKCMLYYSLTMYAIAAYKRGSKLNNGRY